MLPLTCADKPSIPEENPWTQDDHAFVRQFEQTVADTVACCRMFSPDDKILVAVSGGKDSTAVLHVLHKLGYPVEAVTVDAHIGCYTEQNLINLRHVCQQLNVPLHEIAFRKVIGASLCYIRDYLKAQGHNLKSCTVCGVLRRYLLNAKARALGATKLVLGHNLDDEAQVVVMNFIKNRPWMNARLGPVPGRLDDARFVPRVKPLYFLSEEDVVRYAKLMRFPVKFGKCPCSVEGFRNAIKDFLTAQQIIQPDAKRNIVQALLAMLPRLQEKYAAQSVGHCAQCGEPASSGTCKPCSILNKLHEPSQVREFAARELTGTA